jgi:hypothetical protein
LAPLALLVHQDLVPVAMAPQPVLVRLFPAQAGIMNHTTAGFTYKQISASGNVCAVDGIMAGIFISAASNTPTITIYDDAATGTTTKIVDTFTPVAGTWYPLPFAFSKGLNVVVGGTLSATVGFISG